MWDVVSIGFALILVGFGAVVIALMTSMGSERSEVRGAGVVMIGPIPLVFASDSKWASIALVLAIALVLLSLLLYVL